MCVCVCVYVYVYIYYFLWENEFHEPVFHQKPRSCLVMFVYPMGNKLHKQHKMYMANANQSLTYPMRTIFHWFVLELTTGPPGFALGLPGFGLGCRVFGYQDVGICNANP